jgi:hypothetical protein
MKKLSSLTIMSLATLLVLFTAVSALALLFTIVEYTEYKTVWLLLLDFVYLPVCFYCVYRLAKLSEQRSYEEFCTTYNLTR